MKQSLFSLLFLLFFSQTILAQNYSFEKSPDWVILTELPKDSDVSKYDIMSGFYISLADYQIDLEKDAFYTREVRNVISYGGITNASQLSVIYDTAYQKLIIHHLFIWRNGKKLDRTKDLSLEIMNNEFNLHQGIYTGKITAYENLNDIRKDDLIDFAFTLEGDNPIFEKEKFLFVPLQTLNPIDHLTLRVLYPKNKEYLYKCSECDSINVISKEIADKHLIEISDTNIKGFDMEDNIPAWSIPYKYFTLSSFHNWNEVNQWAQKVFSLQNEPELDSVFNEIFTGNETTNQKINLIIDYVQDEIRYMGIEAGIGSIKPFPPEQVVRQRFGDCKDKSLLLVSLLKKIGVNEAWPALVNTIMQNEVDKLYVSNQIFNHCIVRFDYNDTTYWVDPTISQQGGDFRQLFSFNFGKALIIGLENDSLSKMKPQNSGSRAEVIDEFTMNSFTEPARLVIKTERCGSEADQRRAVMEYFTTKDINDQIIKEMKLIYPEVVPTSDVVIRDDMSKNIFRAEYNYEINGFWKDGDKGTNDAAKGFWVFKYEPLSMYQYLNITGCENRKYSYQIEYPVDFHYKVILHFPKELLINDDLDIIDNEVFYYEERFEQLNSTSVQIDYVFQTKTNCITAEKYQEFCQLKNNICNEMPVIFYFNK